MKKILTLAAFLALATGLVFAQATPAQQTPDQTQQMPQTQQTPSAQQTPPYGSQTQTQSSASGSSQTVQSQIQSAFQQQPGLSNVTVNVTDNSVELSGTVASKEDKAKARSTAESSAGGRKIVDKIKVSSGSSGTSSPPQ